MFVDTLLLPYELEGVTIDSYVEPQLRNSFIYYVSDLDASLTILDLNRAIASGLRPLSCSP